MTINMNDDLDLYCPLVGGLIDSLDCDENLAGAETPEIMKSWYPDRFKVKKDWIEICRNCKEFPKELK